MRSKYINTFDTTSEFENYIESAEPGFPNVAYTKDTGDIHYTSTSPNDHLIYGTLSDPTKPPVFSVWSNRVEYPITATVDAVSNTYYIDDLSSWGTGITSLQSLITSNADNVLSIKKFVFDTSSVTNINMMFNGCDAITYINLYGLDTTSVDDTSGAFYYCPNLKTIDMSGWDLSNDDRRNWMFNSNLESIYITEEATLMKLTDNLTMANPGNGFIPSTATIYYNDQVYKWQNGAWTLQ